MRATASATRRSATFFLAFVFLWAVGPDAYGLHPCPEHSSVGAPSHHGAGHAESHPDGPEGPATAADHGGEHHGSACSCIESCVVSASVVAPSPERSVSSDDFPDIRTHVAQRGSDDSELTPRHSPFELHLPNAPPAVPAGAAIPS
ncbi:MAG: hypothetical protein ACOC8K_07760 [Gemmatimonadota bacterium]